MNWYIFSDDAFLSSALTYIQVRAHDLQSQLSLHAPHERVALEKRRKIAPPKKCVIGAFYISMQSLNKMTFTEASPRRNGKTIVFPIREGS